MGKDNLKEVRNIVLIACVTLLFIVYAEKTIGFTTGFMTILTPFFIGVAVAFIIDLPMSFIEENLIGSWDNKKILKHLKRPFSMIISIIIVFGIFAFLISIVMPQVTNTISDVGVRFPSFIKDLLKKLDEITKDYPDVNKYINDIHMGNLNWNSITTSVVNFLKNGVAGDILSSTVSSVTTMAGILLNAFIAFIFAIYALANKDKIKRNIKEICKTYIPVRRFDYLYHVTTLLIHNFKRFVAGQCIESIIIGILFSTVLSIAQMPYAILISMIIAFCALIPMIGYYIGLFIGAFFILMVSPMKTLVFIVIFFVLQQFEANVIYPRTVGNSVGLPAILVFSTVIIGGGIAGIAGMLVSIPITSTVYTLVKEDVRDRNKKNSN